MSDVKNVSSSLIIVPARRASSRLKDKPLKMIGDRPMIVHTMQCAQRARLGDVLVATDDAQIVDVVHAAGGRAVMTRADHPSGSDRIFEAVQAHDPEAKIELIVNLQGDLPDISPHLIQTALKPLDDPQVDIATLVAPIDPLNPADRAHIDNPNMVKCVGTDLGLGQQRLRALYFTRAPAPTGPGLLYHHIGLYVYRRPVLERFVDHPATPLEKRERLEQLRALEMNMRIDAMIVAEAPVGVDTSEDLQEARRRILAQ